MENKTHCKNCYDWKQCHEFGCQKPFTNIDKMENKEYNGGECKVNCNCVEIAEFKNGGEGVKSYACLKRDVSDIPKMKSSTENKEYTLQDAQDKEAQLSGYKNFDSFYKQNAKEHVYGIMKEAAELYKTKATENLRKEKEIADIKIANSCVLAIKNEEIEELRKENDALKEKVKRQDKEYILNGSIQEWKDYSERTTAKINELTESNKELLEALKALTKRTEQIYRMIEYPHEDMSGEVALKNAKLLIQKSEGENKKDMNYRMAWDTALTDGIEATGANIKPYSLFLLYMQSHFIIQRKSND